MKEAETNEGVARAPTTQKGRGWIAAKTGRIYSANRLEVSEKGLPLQPASIERNALRSAPLTRFFEEV